MHVRRSLPQRQITAAPPGCNQWIDRLDHRPDCSCLEWRYSRAERPCCVLPMWPVPPMMTSLIGV